ncbi:MAG: NAD(P)H-binding protein [Cyanobacteria bacterium SZAS TMP-1]|nr:NAD(P)H-binding protein [Cyanobacteria bacterium SZAS TMP-1]
MIGATGHVGSKVAVLLANKGHDVTALVRHSGARIEDPYHGTIKYVVGNLSDEESLRAALQGVDVVISTANGIAPQNSQDNANNVNEGAQRLIELCEEAGVKRFVQSSVPTYKYDYRVPELTGKRAIEQKLFKSKLQAVIVRNPAFMDVFIVMAGFRRAQDKSRHATTRRQYGLLKLYMGLVGDFVEKRGWLIAPGGANHGTPTICTRDVAEMMVGASLYGGTENLVIEAGGPAWLTWREIAEIIAKKVGREKIHIIPLPGWLARFNQMIVQPFSAPAANIFALMGFVADFQPHWNSSDVILKLNLPRQMTLSDYLDANYPSI